jgi:hypothetical protein
MRLTSSPSQNRRVRAMSERVVTAIVVSVAAAFLLTAGPAWSLTIANQDESEREVTIVHAGAENKLKFSAGQSMTLEENHCAQGCSVTGTSGRQ